MTEKQKKHLDELIDKFNKIPESEMDMPINDELRKEIIAFLQKTLIFSNEK